MDEELDPNRSGSEESDQDRERPPNRRFAKAQEKEEALPSSSVDDSSVPSSNSAAVIPASETQDESMNGADGQQESPNSNDSGSYPSTGQPRLEMLEILLQG